MIGFSLASDWLREWCEFSGPITERSKAKQRNPGLFDAQLEIASISFITMMKSPKPLFAAVTLMAQPLGWLINFFCDCFIS